VKEAERNFDSREMNSATFVLASVGEEAGYKEGSRRGERLGRHASWP
jgi:hypothetical protein